jgi:hypothetical protein
MARKDDVFVQAVLDACAEAGIREGVQGFAANMSRSLAAMEKSGKLSVFQVAMALSWEGRFVFGNKIQRRPFAELILENVQRELTVFDHPYDSDAMKQKAAKEGDERQMALWA